MRLSSFLAGRWQDGRGAGTPLVDPTSGAELGRASSEGLDLASALTWSRETGGPALRALSFAQRGERLAAVAAQLTERRAQYVEIARCNSGNTAFDAAFDIDGAIGTLKFYARLGKTLGDVSLLRDGEAERLARDEAFQSLHLLTPRRGVAVQINAFNFPAWGLWEKAAVSLLAGVPVFAKPATSTAWLTQQMVRDVVEGHGLPDGAISLLCGAPGGLLDALDWRDSVAFTGSAQTARQLRAHPALLEHAVPLNVEADSLNACVLGSDVSPDTPAFAAFIKEVAREMTVKAGQKCTAIRRVLVPRARLDAVAEALSAALAKVAVGNPANEGVRMGPLVNRRQQQEALAGIERLRAAADVVCGGRADGALMDADAHRGCFVMPTVLRARDAEADVIHDVEVFGPVSTLIGYDGAAEAARLAIRGRGSLVASAFSADSDFLLDLAQDLAHAHGRLMLLDDDVLSVQTGHGNVLPSCVHGGPGRAGGGEELGGTRGLRFHLQRTAIQGAASTLAALAGRSAPVTI